MIKNFIWKAARIDRITTEDRNVVNFTDSPPFRNVAECRVLKRGAKERGGCGVEVYGLAAIEFGADGVEIHEPTLEQRPRDRLQRGVHPPVQLDLVVQRTKYRRDGFLLGKRWMRNRQSFKQWNTEIAYCRARTLVNFNFVLNCIRLNGVQQKARVTFSRVRPKHDHPLPKATSKAIRNHAHLAHRCFARDH